jgi:hypothetical protein
MSQYRLAHDHRGARQAGWRAVSVAGTCSTCSLPACDLLGHLFAHLLSWTNRPRPLPAKSIINLGNVRNPACETAVEKTFAGETGRNRWIDLGDRRDEPARSYTPRTLFFAYPDPHGVAMLRNIC